MPKKDSSVMNNNEQNMKDQRVFIPSPVVSSTDAFRLNTGLTPLPPKSPTELSTNGDAWHHTELGQWLVQNLAGVVNRAGTKFFVFYHLGQ